MFSLSNECTVWLYRVVYQLLQSVVVFLLHESLFQLDEAGR